MSFSHRTEIAMGFDTRVLTGGGVLAAVTESGNFARAAETLGLTPSGVSRAVARLEARVGVRLFDRTPRAVTLTEEGRRFHAQVMPLLASIEEAATEVAGAAGGGGAGPTPRQCRPLVRADGAGAPPAEVPPALSACVAGPARQQPSR